MLLKPTIGLESEPPPPEPSVDFLVHESIESTGEQKFLKPRTTIIPNPALAASSAVKESVSEALTKAGILDSLIESERRKATVRTSLKANYADIGDAVRIIADNMRNSDSFSVRQRAAEKVLELHGIDSKANSDMSINVIIDGNLNVANILNPHREKD